VNCGAKLLIKIFVKKENLEKIFFKVCPGNQEKMLNLKGAD
jgi:hypothetical protein